MSKACKEKKKYLDPQRRNPVSEQIDPLKYFILITNAYVDNDNYVKSYFSRANVDHLQKLMSDQIYNKTDGLVRIGRQDDQALLDIMIEEYMSYPYEKLFYQPCNPWENTDAVSIYEGGLTKQLDVTVPEMISDVNKRVLSIAVPRIVRGLQEFYRFREHITKKDWTHGGQMSNRFPGRAGINTRNDFKDEKPIDNTEQNELNAPIKGKPKPFAGARLKRMGEVTTTFGEGSNPNCSDPVTIKGMKHDDIRRAYMRNMANCART